MKKTSREKCAEIYIFLTIIKNFAKNHDVFIYVFVHLKNLMWHAKTFLKESLWLSFMMIDRIQRSAVQDSRFSKTLIGCFLLLMLFNTFELTFVHFDAQDHNDDFTDLMTPISAITAQSVLFGMHVYNPLCYISVILATDEEGIWKCCKSSLARFKPEVHFWLLWIRPTCLKTMTFLLFWWEKNSNQNFQALIKSTGETHSIWF